MAEKITSIAGLRKRVDNLTGDPEIYRKDVEDLIGEFAASVRKQIDVLETIPAESVRHVRAKELRRILGEEDR